MLRNNAFVAILIAIALLLCIKPIRKTVLILFASILVLFCLVSGPIYSLVGIQPTAFCRKHVSSSATGRKSGDRKGSGNG